MTDEQDEIFETIHEREFDEEEWYDTTEYDYNIEVNNPSVEEGEDITDN
jgi:hypothetical protein